MTALPLQTPMLRLATTSLPAPLRRIFDSAGLAEPRATLDELAFETDSSPEASKILISFSLSRSDLNLFLLLSPALAGVAPGMRGAAADAPHEPDFPWWGPEPDGASRWFTFSTAVFDVVDVVVEDAAGRISIRALRAR